MYIGWLLGLDIKDKGYDPMKKMSPADPDQDDQKRNSKEGSFQDILSGFNHSVYWNIFSISLLADLKDIIINGRRKSSDWGKLNNSIQDSVNKHWVELYSGCNWALNNRPL